MEGAWQGKDVLEPGSGDGRVTQHLARRAKSVTCVDISEKMLKLNQSKLEGHPQRNRVEYHKCFVQDFHPDRTFDVAVVSQVLIHNVNDESFRSFVSKVAELANVIFVFEDITQTRRTSIHTKLRKKSDIIQAFSAQGCHLTKDEEHMMHEDHIALLRFSKDNDLSQVITASAITQAD